MEVILLTSVLPYRLDDKNVQGRSLYRGMGAYQVAWYLREHNYNVQVIDFVFQRSEAEVVDAVSRYVTDETKVIGFGVLGNTVYDRLLYLRVASLMFKLKEKFPRLKYVGGGPTANRFDWFLPPKLFDHIIVGHAEDTMLAYCNHVFRNGPAVPFEISARGNRLIKESFSVPVEKKFDIQHDRHRWHERDFVQPGESLPIETTRGCIFKCKFCQYPLIGKHKLDFLRDMELIKEEMIDNYNKFGTTNYYMLDDTFNADKDRVEAFANMAASLPFKIRYATYLRLDLIEAHRQTEDMLKESGLFGAFFGVETFNKEAASLIGKSFSGKKAKDYLPELAHQKWNSEIIIFCGMIAGIPPETVEELWETNQWLKDNNINGWHWNGLHLSNHHIKEWSSEFEQNAEQYGFRFTGPDQWAHGEYHTSQKARQWALDLVKDSISHQRTASWNGIELLNYPSMTTHEILTRRVKDYNLDHPVHADRKKFLDNYWYQIMNS